MYALRQLLGLAVMVLLTACGGGGAPVVTPVVTPAISLSVVDQLGVNLGEPALISSGSPYYYVRAVVTDATAKPVQGAIVSFSVDGSVSIIDQNGVATTNSNGEALLRITPASLTLSKIGELSAEAVKPSQKLSVSALPIVYRTLAASVNLANFAKQTATISALQSTAVTVDVLINGLPAAASALAVDFLSSCGTFSPASALTGSNGRVSTTYLASVNCSGPVELTASSNGATPISTSIQVNPAAPANVLFDSASVPLMVSSLATNGLKQSTLRYRVVDSAGAGMPGQSLSISLSPSTLNSGVRFSVGGLATSDLQIVTSDTQGFANVTVTSGSSPTPVIVTAALASNSSIAASSLNVAVTSGRPTQRAASLAATNYSLEAFNKDGETTQLTMRVADRQGNAIPSGAVVSFVASHGKIDGACTIGSDSGCSVTYTTQGTRPSNGRVAVLAFMDGEESFKDLNGDNVWQSNEPYWGVGLLFRDDNEDGVRQDTGYTAEEIYPGGVTGNFPCAAGLDSYPSVENTCLGTWNSSIRIRKQVTLVLSTGMSVTTLSTPKSPTGFTVSVADGNGNSLPNGSTVGAELVTPSGVTLSCNVLSVSPTVVKNSPNATSHAIELDGGADCQTAQIKVTVVTPNGTTSSTKL